MSYDRDLAFEYHNPTKVIFGENSIKEIGLEVESLGGSKALVVTDRGIKEAGLAEKVEKALGRRYVATFDQCIPDSGFHLVDEGASFALEKGADILVSVGGGSVIDTAKGMAMVMKEGGKLSDYRGIQVLNRPQTPHIVVPTTAGSGSEMTWFAVIKDWERNVKESFVDVYLIPNKAILDPTMVAGLSPHLTAGPGMDSLSHAVEAIHSLQRQPIIDGMALQAARLVMEFLPRCVEKGDDLVARGQQQLAAAMAGIAFGNSQPGLVHAMAHPVGALYKVPHGVANAILLPHVMNFNMKECADRYALLARAMNLDVRSLSDKEAAGAAVEAVQDLVKRIGLPQKLREVDVPEEGLEEAADYSLADGSIVYNPRLVTDSEEVLEVYRAAW